MTDLQLSHVIGNVGIAMFLTLPAVAVALLGRKQVFLVLSVCSAILLLNTVAVLAVYNRRGLYIVGASDITAVLVVAVLYTAVLYGGKRLLIAIGKFTSKRHSTQNGIMAGESRSVVCIAVLGVCALYAAILFGVIQLCNVGSSAENSLDLSLRVGTGRNSILGSGMRPYVSEIARYLLVDSPVREDMTDSDGIAIDARVENTSATSSYKNVVVVLEFIDRATSKEIIVRRRKSVIPPGATWHYTMKTSSDGEGIAARNIELGRHYVIGQMD